MKDKLLKMLSAKKEQREKLNQAMIESESKEERAAIGETLAALGSEIAEVENMLADVDAPAAAEGEAASEGERKFSPVAAIAQRTSAESKNSAEERAANLSKTGRMSISVQETRSTLLSTGTIAKPTSVGGINDPFNTVSSIVDMVRVEDMTGMGGHKEAYITA